MHHNTDRPGQAIKVFLLANHPIIAFGLEQLLRQQASMLAFVGSADCLAEAQTHLENNGVDIVIVDVDTQNAPEVIPQVLNGQARVLALAGSREVDVTDQAIMAGASGVVHKDAPLAVLLKAIERVHAGEVWVDRTAMGRILNGLSRPARSDPNHARIERLTRKERQVITALAHNASANGHHIASSLHISERTLRNHLSAIYAKLELSNRVELYAFAQRYPLGLD